MLILGMFVYNDLLFGPRFRREVMPKIRFAPLALCCASFCGVDVDEPVDRDQVGRLAFYMIDENLIDELNTFANLRI